MVARKVGGVFLDKDYKIVEKEDVVKLCVEAHAVVFKKAPLSEGGKGIQFWENDRDSIGG